MRSLQVGKMTFWAFATWTTLMAEVALAQITVPPPINTAPPPTPAPAVPPDPLPVISVPPGYTAAMPMGRPGGWVTEDDYPVEALRTEVQGTTTFRAEIASDGIVTGCSIVKSSGSQLLDDATCRLITERARFFPALDRKRRAIAGSYVNRIRWTLPDAGDGEGSLRALVPENKVLTFMVGVDGMVSDCQLTVNGVSATAEKTAYFCSKAIRVAPFLDAAGKPVKRKVTMSSSLTVSDPNADIAPPPVSAKPVPRRKRGR